ncbi:hypothetical protein YWA314_14534 [Yersinia enterocolitica subsp. enterocolitica WA-314]|nr:hypothetical protein YWA314_14534 [Yersinia enterocolitica subsp. enterocolitica WA-314]
MLSKINIRLLTNLKNPILQGEGRLKSKASVPRMAGLEPTRTLVLTKEVRRLYDLPVFTVTGTLSLTSLIFSLSSRFKVIKT